MWAEEELWGRSPSSLILTTATWAAVSNLPYYFLDVHGPIL